MQVFIPTERMCESVCVRICVGMCVLYLTGGQSYTCAHHSSGFSRLSCRSEHRRGKKKYKNDQRKNAKNPEHFLGRPQRPHSFTWNPTTAGVYGNNLTVCRQ